MRRDVRTFRVCAALASLAALVVVLETDRVW
jgi:hypothetical protein